MSHAFPDVAFLEEKNLQKGDLFYDSETNHFFILTNIYRSAVGLFYLTIYNINKMQYDKLSGSWLAGLWEDGIVERQ